MQRAIRLLLRSSVVGSVALLGCSHASQQVGRPCAACAAAAQAGRLAPVAQAPETGHAVTVIPAASSSGGSVRAGQAPRLLSGGVTSMARADSGDPVVVPVAFDSDQPETAPEATPPEKKVRRRSFSDITAKPCFGHATDYTWLTGELQFTKARNSWRLRYASVDEDDVYGGGVTLVPGGPMDEFHDGQLVRVEGQLADPNTQDPSPGYRVRTIVPLDRP